MAKFYKRCLVDSCPSNKRYIFDAKLYKFPSKEEILTKWKANLKLDDGFLAKYSSLVCRRHFESECIAGLRLKAFAVPTLNLGYDGEPPYSYCIPRKAVYRKCCMKNCLSTSQNEKMFRFPSDPVRRQSWVQFCEVEDKPSLRICQNHFDDKYLQGTFLPLDAFPSQFYQPRPSLKRPRVEEPTDQECEVIADVVYAQKQNEHQEYEGLGPVLTCGCDLKFAKKEKYYQKTMKSMREKLETLEETVRSLENSLQSIKKKAIVPDVNTSEYAKTFAKMIVGKDHHYSEDEKTVVQNIQYTSTACYNLMKEDLKFKLPSLASIHRWRPIKNLHPGIDRQLTAHLSPIVNGMKPHERECSLIFDEMIVRPDLEYNNSTDTIDGFVDHGKNSRCKALATKCLVVMLKSTLSNWKFVFSYYATASINFAILKGILMENLEYASELGFKVNSVICDQCPTNVSLFLSLGGHIYHNGRKIRLLYDYCHLIKSVRNALISTDIKIESGIASHKVLKAMFKEDQKNEHFRVCPKLTAEIVDPSPFHKMSVRKAAQLLSQSTVHGIEYYRLKGLFSGELSQFVEPTKQYSQTFNNMFDDFNCKVINDPNPLKRPLIRGSQAKRDRLMGYIEFLKNLTPLSKPKNFKCFSGLISTIQSILELSEDLFQMYPEVDYLFIGKLNQDALENTFFKVRSSSGLNSHPSINEMRYILAGLISMKVITHSASKRNNNCEPDNSLMLELEHVQREAIAANLELNEENAVDYSSIVELEIPEASNSNEPQVPNLACERYYIGYGVNKIFNKIQCDKCLVLGENFNKILSSPSEQLIKIKNYQTPSNRLHLQNPSDALYEMCVEHFMIYKKLFPILCYQVDVKKEIINAIKRETSLMHGFQNWFDDESCGRHREQFIDFLIKVLLYKNSKWLASAMISQKSSE